MQNDLIISLAVDGRDRYSDNVKGLEASIEKHWKGDTRIFKEFPDYVTPHSVVPYKFKFDLIKQAVKDGYTRIWWMDSTMRLNRDISDFLNNRHPLVFFENEGHPLYKFISDEAVNNFKLAKYFFIEKDLYHIKQLWGGILGFNFSHAITNYIFEDLEQQIELGSFKDGISERKSFIAHRHDQSCLSVIAHYYNIPLLPYGLIASKQDATEETYIIYGS